MTIAPPPVLLFSIPIVSCYRAATVESSLLPMAASLIVLTTPHTKLSAKGFDGGYSILEISVSIRWHQTHAIPLSFELTR